MGENASQIDRGNGITVHPGMLRRNINIREPGDVYCPKTADYVDFKSVCRKCQEYSEDLVLYYNCRLKKEEANRLAKGA